MQIILTHEQADFDALASLLGAALLFEDATPVLPRRINRNVLAFLSLYGSEVPFVHPKDLGSVAIDQVILVDTQAMVSLKGMQSHLSVRVIDHHPARPNLPLEWDVQSENLGATATILVEALEERGETLAPIHATLLLLGIYEDTGSLTYSRTTPRDLRAVAYLLEQGASLRTAADFLNHPLSLGQQALYDQLRRDAQALTIHGHSVIISCGQAQGSDEELSTIVHKLRDLLDPDIIFVLVEIRGGIQLIARATSDSINVAAVAAHFGGGGHERAAAALVHHQTLAQVHAELQRILPEHIRPAVTVAQIMSRGVQVLSPDASVEEAAQRMRRYGYEGYPVVKNGQVIGLLTRRAVDRALSHRLQRPVSSLMDAGSYRVTPDDPLEYVQSLITSTGWGQIPVVDPASGKIIGIVTRTDLLKSLAPVPGLPGSRNLAERLETALPPDRLALLQTIASMAHAQHAALYIVGGFVRDLLLNQPGLDFDLVVEGDAIALARALEREYGGRATGHSRFGTAKWRLDEPGQPARLSAAGLPAIDLVSARTEFYTHPVALPTVERGSIKLDLHRRDFTINTLALRLDGRHYGELYDYWGGLDDLRLGLVRVLHSLSFVDDPTRILRAVRFEQRFGFQIEERSMQLLQEARSMIPRLTGDRIRHELNHILRSGHAPRILARLQDLGLLADISPSLVWDAWLEGHFAALAQPLPGPDWELPASDPDLQLHLAYCLWLIRLAPDEARKVGDRLKLPAALQKVIEAACGLWQDQARLAGLSPSQATLRLEDVPPLARYALYLAAPDEAVRAQLRSYAETWRKVQPGVDGQTLKALKIPPGPVYKLILGELRRAWLDGRLQHYEQERAMLNELLQRVKTLFPGEGQ